MLQSPSFPRASLSFVRDNFLLAFFPFSWAGPTFVDRKSVAAVLGNVTAFSATVIGREACCECCSEKDHGGAAPAIMATTDKGYVFKDIIVKIQMKG